MAYKNTEIELKFSLPNPEDVINFLNINAKKIFDSTDRHILYASA